jgi:hypothetical protein
LSDKKPYNPLEKGNLAESIVRAILDSPVHPLLDVGHLVGAGVYIIYYTGNFELYAPIVEKNIDNKFTQPIYIGKAIPKGGRKGGISEDAAAKGKALKERLSQHYASVNETDNLDAADFYYQCLIVDDIWIPLGENMLIEQFKPIWNRALDGFGNKDPGNRRKTQYRSPWDVLHPGRKFAEKLAQHPRSAQEISEDLKIYFKTGSVTKRLKEASENSKETDEES